MPFPAALTDRERLLFHAVLTHDPGPNPRLHTANGGAILKHAMTAAGVWDQQRYGALGYVDESFAEPESWYQALIEMSRRPEAERLVEGFGNLGFDGNPLACPAYVKFAPTDLGRRAASSHLAEANSG